jgi:uracil-DNA glycosylase
VPAGLAALEAEARACIVCATHLPFAPRPVFRVSSKARVLIISQAPGTRAHNTALPWNDAAGDRLRGWLGMNRDQFYDASRLAIMPMGFCYPGVLPQGGDKPPRPECAPLWHDRFLALMPAVALTLLIGGYAQTRYLGRGTMTARVREFAKHPGYFAMPHPSWRTIGWEARNPWFAAEVVPALREAIAGVM